MNIRMIKLFLNSAIRNLNTILDAIFILDRDDQIVAHINSPQIPENSIDNIDDLLKSSLAKISAEFDGHGFGISTFCTGQFRLIFSEAGAQVIIGFVAPLDSDVQLLFSYIFLCAEKIARINLETATSFVLPIFNQEGNITDKSSGIQHLSLKDGKFIMKVILGGDSRVGKTTLVEQFVNETFSSDFKSTIGLNMMKRSVNYRHWNIEVTFSVFDMGGQEQFKDVRKVYYQGARAGFIVFDVTNYESFQNVTTWAKEITAVEPQVLLVLIGNKVDLEDQRKVPKQEAKDLSNRLGMKYIETSALDKDLVDEAFRTLGFFYILKNRMVEIQPKL